MINKENIKEHVESLTPEERTKFIKELSDEMIKIYQVIDDHREYLESIPTKEERIKEQQKIIKNYTDDRRKNN